LISIVHILLPLPIDLEDELCIQLVSNLSQMIIRNDNILDHENDNNISLLNTTTRMKKTNVDILCNLIKDLIKSPIFISDKTLGKFNFNNKQYDYEERVSDDEIINKRKSRSRLRKNNSN